MRLMRLRVPMMIPFASAVTVTGLTTVSTAANWSFFGQFVILVAMQIGGLGTLTMTSILALAIGRKLGLKSRLITQEALNIGRLGEVGSLLQIIVLMSVTIEAILATVLIARGVSGLVCRVPIYRGLAEVLTASAVASTGPGQGGRLS